MAKRDIAALGKVGVAQSPAHRKRRIRALRLRAGQRLEGRPQRNRPVPHGPRPRLHRYARLDLPNDLQLSFKEWMGVPYFVYILKRQRPPGQFDTARVARPSLPQAIDREVGERALNTAV